MAYSRIDDGLVTTINLNGAGDVSLIASEIRRQASGVHARIAIGHSGKVLTFSTFNIDRDEDRVRLVNSAFKQAPPELPKVYKNADLKHDLDLFCLGLWPEWVAADEGEFFGGDEEPSLPVFVLEPFIILGGGTVLFAPPGKGKSYTGMLMAVSVDANCSKLWPVRTPMRTLYVNLERSTESMTRRLGLVNAVLGLPRSRPLLMLNKRGRRLSDVSEAVKKTIKTHDVGCLILDSVSRSGYGDLTENEPVNAFVDTMNRLAPTWIGLAHTPRNDDTHAFGSMMFDAGEDLGVMMATDDVDEVLTGVGLKIMKANDTRKPPMQILAYEWNSYGLMNVRHSSLNEFPALEIAGGKLNHTEMIKRFILENSGSSYAGEIEEATGIARPNVVKLLGGRDFVKLEKSGKRQYYGVAAPF